MATVPIVSPAGDVGDVPFAQMRAALAAGGKPGVTIKSPDGKLGVVPADRYQDAVKAGGTVVPYQEQDTQHPGFWAHAADLMGGMLHPSGFSPYPGMDQEAKSAAATQATQQDQARKQAGYSAPYRALAPVAESVGMNVPAMEQSAKEGDIAGVAAGAAVPLATLGAGEALAHGAGPVADAAAPAVRATVKTINAGLKKAPGTIGTAAGAALGAASHVPYGAEIGAGLGGVVGREVLPQVQIPGERFGLPAEEIEAPDATGENKPYAGAPKPKLEKELDATGENRPFLGGMDEPLPPKKPAQSATAAKPAPRAVVIDPESGAPEFSDVVAQKQSAAQTTPQPKAAAPQTTAPAATSGTTDPILARLQQNASRIQAEEASAKTSSPEDDLTAPLQQMLDEVLKKKAAGVKPFLNRLARGEAGQAGAPGAVTDADEGIADIQNRPVLDTLTREIPARGYLNGIGADENSVLKTQGDLDSVFYHRQQIAKNGTPNVELHVDEGNNIIGANGRHRALAAIQQGGPNAKVNLTIFQHPDPTP